MRYNQFHTKREFEKFCESKGYGDLSGFKMATGIDWSTIQGKLFDVRKDKIFLIENNKEICINEI